MNRKMSLEEAGQITNPESSESKDIDLVCGSDEPSLIPEGTYQAFCSGFNKGVVFGKYVLFLYFKIQSGPYENTEIFMPFNLPRGKKIPLGSKYHRAWCITNGGKPQRGDRMSPRIFLKKAFLISVVTVTKDGGQRILPDFLKYSKGKNILEKLNE